MLYKHTQHKQDDTTLEVNDGTVLYTFCGARKESEKFTADPLDLFIMLCDYYENRKNQELFSGLSVSAQDALWNILYSITRDKIHLSELYPQC